MLSVWVDGSCLGNPGPGGWAVYAPDAPPPCTTVGGKRWATNNEMELIAIAQALERYPTQDLLIFSDSEWSLKAIGGQYKSTKHIELVSVIRNRMGSRQVTFRWVRAHSKSPQNNIADALAHREAQYMKSLIMKEQ